MNKKEYLFQLRRYLQGFPTDEVNDILSDYEEHFSIGVSKGKTEEEISKELGNPSDIAKTYKTTYGKNPHRFENTGDYTNSNDTTRKILIGFLLFFFNLIIVLGPFIVVVALLFALYVISIAFIFGGFVAFFGSPLVVLTPIPAPHFLTSLSIGLGMVALGGLALILAIYLSKLFIEFTIKYIKWNLKLINGQEVI